MHEFIPSARRGHANHGWLDSYHSFSFADFYDPQRMGFGPLRVINEDRIAPGTGFGTHGHRNMEIISYVAQGGLAHRDSLGHSGVIEPGQVQRMSAGKGIMHSEYNHAADATTHFFQIWIEPNQLDLPPSYEQGDFSTADKRGRLCLIASPDGAESSLRLHQDARFYAGLFDGAESCSLPLAPGRLAYVHAVQGQIEVNGVRLNTGDALQISQEASLHLMHGNSAEVLVFDLPS
ncbi:pirin family protein [Roseateles sp. BYS180W]|uniref:Pirin family protein n=1 Tax=Roseateles rivi TaxID=3299028 RepID=A0ABW7FV60_9BURK